MFRPKHRPGTTSSRGLPADYREALKERVIRARLLTLLLDFDGTLVEITPRPEEAALETAMKDLLRRLARNPRTRVAIISGRALEDLKAKVGLDECYLAGTHGLTVEGPTIRFVHPAAARGAPAMRVIARRLRMELSSVPGTLVEEKQYSVACHYRMVPRPAVAAVKAAARRIALEGTTRSTTNDSSGWRILQGKQVLEFIPQVRWTKGSCAEYLLSHFRSQTPDGGLILPLAAGDDRTDTELFSAVGKAGVTFAVDSRALGADWALRGVPEMRALLEWLHDIVSG